MARMLDEELLNALEQRWRDQSPAMIQLLQPGLQNDEIDRLSEPLDFPLPEEVRTWYRWHDGSSNQPLILWRAFGTLADDVTTTLAYQQDEEQCKKAGFRSWTISH